MTEAWRLEANRATLRTPELSAMLDATQPGLGLQSVFRGEQKVADSLFGVGLESETLRLVDCFVRTSDLVGRYETANGQTHLTAYWRLSHAEGSGIGIDLVASVSTDVLEAFPDLRSSSTYRDSNAVLWQAGDDANEKSDRAVIVAGDGWSAVELPLEGSHAEPSVPTDGEQPSVSWRLASGFMEKGVIRRAVLRCRLQHGASQPSDTQVAAWLEDLRVPGPPLSA
ncbi:MAG: hypothetical protein AAGA92_01010 [Planctomycetota bacterium]